MRKMVVLLTRDQSDPYLSRILRHFPLDTVQTDPHVRKCDTGKVGQPNIYSRSRAGRYRESRSTKVPQWRALASADGTLSPRSLLMLGFDSRPSVHATIDFASLDFVGPFYKSEACVQSDCSRVPVKMHSYNPDDMKLFFSVCSYLRV